MKVDDARYTDQNTLFQTPLNLFLRVFGPMPRRSPHALQLSTRVILGMVEEIKAGGEPSPVPENLIDSFRATLTQKVEIRQSNLRNIPKIL